MKKLLLPSIIAMLAVPAFADTVTTLPNNAVCNETNLGTSSGTADIEVAWEANTITTQWYTGYGENTVAASATTCTYDGTINLPQTNPTRAGYAFNGWKLRQQCSFSNLNTSSNGTASAARELDGSNTSSTGGATVSTYGLSSAGDWGVTFSNGYATGISFCSDASGGSNPGSTSGEHCWCKATAYTLNGGTSCQVTQSHNSWVEVPVAAIEGISSCVNFCAGQCAANARTSSSYRLAMFGESNFVSQCSFSSINTSSDGTASAAKSLSGGSDSTYGGATASTYGLSHAGDWGVTFSNGYITGTSVCSTLSSGNNPGSTSGQYCWCKATGYTVTGQSSQSVSNTEWAYNFNQSVGGCIGDGCSGSMEAWCSQNCAADCANTIRNSSSYREELLCGDSGSGNGGGSQVEPVDPIIDEIL